MSQSKEQIRLKRDSDSARVIVGLSESTWQQLMDESIDLWKAAWKTRYIAHQQDCIEVLYAWRSAAAHVAIMHGRSSFDVLLRNLDSEQWTYFRRTSPEVFQHTCILLQKTQEQLLGMSSIHICRELQAASEAIVPDQRHLHQNLCINQPALMLLELQGIPVDVVRIVAQYTSSYFQQSSTYNSIFRLVA
jgi:hypothetical protein